MSAELLAITLVPFRPRGPRGPAKHTYHMQHSSEVETDKVGSSKCGNSQGETRSTGHSLQIKATMQGDVSYQGFSPLQNMQCRAGMQEKEPPEYGNWTKNSRCRGRMEDSGQLFYTITNIQYIVHSYLSAQFPFNS